MMHSPQTARLTAVDQSAPLDETAVPPQGSVMVIDDSMTVRTVIEASLRRRGYDVNAFGDGLAAMGAMARGEVPVPDLLLLDIGLPKMDGYEVARILRSKPDFGQTVIVMLTAHDGVIDRIRSKMVGASAYITKPFRVNSVVDVVRQFVKPTSSRT
jgi:twitching motility two-component system response regulator PilG